MKTSRAKVACLSGSVIAVLGTLYAFQEPFREYPGIEYNNFPLPSDYQEKTVWTSRRRLAARLLHVDAGLSTCGPSLPARDAAPDSYSRPIRGAAGEPRRR